MKDHGEYCVGDRRNDAKGIDIATESDVRIGDAYQQRDEHKYAFDQKLMWGNH